MKREITLLVDGEAISVTAERRGDRIIVERDGQVHEVVVTGDRIVLSDEAVGRTRGSSGSPPATSTSPSPMPPASPAGASGAAGDVRAPMVGVVREIHAGAGIAVSAGDLIITMEAMKMDIYVNAPVTGTVAAVLCAVGETATEGAVLATVTPTAGAGGTDGGA